MQYGLGVMQLSVRREVPLQSTNTMTISSLRHLMLPWQQYVVKWQANRGRAEKGPGPVPGCATVRVREVSGEQVKTKMTSVLVEWPFSTPMYSSNKRIALMALPQLC